MYEELMLELLCFDLSAPSPLKYLVTFFEELTAVGITSATIKDIRNYTWAVICDTHHSTLGLITTPRIIAITTLMFAATAKKVTIPRIKGQDWWEHLGGTESKIVEAGIFLHHFLSNSPFQITDQDQPGNAAAKYLHASSGKEEQNGEDNSEQNQNGNGHTHENGTNGSDSQTGHEPRNDQPIEKAENNYPDSKPPTSLTTDDARPSPTSGTDDAPLKAAANDLSTHDHNQSSNNVSSNIDSDSIISPKRKADEQLEEGTIPKRAKRDDTNDESLAALEGPEPSNMGKTPPDESQNTIQNDTDDAPKIVEPKVAPAEIEAGADAEDQQEEGELTQ